MFQRCKRTLEQLKGIDFSIFCKIGSSLNSQFPFKLIQHVCQKHDQQRLLTHSKEIRIYMLNEKLQIVIDKETTKDVLVLHEKTCDMAFNSTQVGTPRTNYVPMGATHTNKMTIRWTNL